ncbi:unnamed protein product, partial [Urochloa humidicola]
MLSPSPSVFAQFQILEGSINAKENVSADGVVPVPDLIEPVPRLKCYFMLEDTAHCWMHHQVQDGSSETIWDSLHSKPNSNNT